MRRTVSTSSVEKNLYAQWQAGTMTSGKNAELDKFLFSMSKTDKFVSLFALQTQFGDIPYSRGAFAVYPPAISSRCALSKKPVLLLDGSIDLLQASGVVFRDVVGVHARKCCAFRYPLHWCFFGRSNKEMFFLSQLPIKVSGSSARASL